MAGWDWRVLAHKRKTGDPVKLRSENESKFDELVVDDWFHMEMMNNNPPTYWLRIGDKMCDIVIKPDGSIKIINGTLKDWEDA